MRKRARDERDFPEGPGRESCWRKISGSRRERLTVVAAAELKTVVFPRMDWSPEKCCKDGGKAGERLEIK